MAANTPIPVDPTDTLAVLKAAEEWLSDPARWTRGVDWRDEFGDQTCDRLGVACCCVTGALTYVTGADGVCAVPETAYHALMAALGGPVPSANDGPNGYEIVMAGLRKAIETLESRP